MKKKFFAVALATTMALSSVMTASAADIYTTDYAFTSNDAYKEIDNPLKGKNLDKIVIEYTCTTAEGAAANGWDGLFAFYNPETEGRISFQTRPYLCWNDKEGGAGFIDINHPDNKEGTFALKAGEQQTVVWTITADSVVCTVDGEKIETGTDGKSADTVTYTDLLTAFNTYPKLTIGVGKGKTSFWWTELASGKITISDGKTSGSDNNTGSSNNAGSSDNAGSSNNAGSSDNTGSSNNAGSDEKPTTTVQETTTAKPAESVDVEVTGTDVVKATVGGKEVDLNLTYGKVTDAEKTRVAKIIEDKLAGKVDKFFVFDITAAADGVKVEKLDAAIKVTYDLKGTGFEAMTDLTVYRAETNGDLTEMKNVTVADGKISFETDHFSTYVIAKVKVKEQTPPDSGDAAPIVVFVAVAVAAAGVVASRKKLV